MDNPQYNHYIHLHNHANWTLIPSQVYEGIKKEVGVWCGTRLNTNKIMNNNKNNSPGKTEKNRMIGSQRLYVGQ